MASISAIESSESNAWPNAAIVSAKAVNPNPVLLPFLPVLANSSHVLISTAFSTKLNRFKAIKRQLSPPCIAISEHGLVDTFLYPG